MNELYPLKFKPHYRQTIWGGNKLQEIFGRDLNRMNNVGESWEISGLEGHVSVVSNGFLRGNTLTELIEVYMGDLVGERVFEKYGLEFPLLIKYIDASDILSIQVHPDDRLAEERHQCRGKTEMWYVIGAEKDASLMIGFNRDTTRNEYLEYLASQRLHELMNVEKVQKGDVFYIPAGTLHAVGAGVFLAEIQQSSDITYRVYDWDRQDEHGRHRELHTHLAIDAINFTKCNNYRIPAPDVKTVPLVKSPYFQTNFLPVGQTAERDFYEIDSFIVYMCLNGACRIASRNHTIPLTSGDTVLVPASLNSMEIIPATDTTLLEVYMP